MEINAQLATLIALAIPVVTEIQVRWKQFPLERKNAPIAVIIMSFLFALIYTYANNGLYCDQKTVELVFGYTSITVMFASFAYEYIYKVLILRTYKYLVGLVH
jgi:hypothetical protein